jgi:hypothetical protein
MSLVKYYHVTDSQMSKIPPAHDLNGLTRLQLRLSRLDEVACVRAPSLDDMRISEHENDFIWCYCVERQIGVSWAQVDAAVAKAFREFMSVCAVS